MTHFEKLSFCSGGDLSCNPSIKWWGYFYYVIVIFFIFFHLKSVFTFVEDLLKTKLIKSIYKPVDIYLFKVNNGIPKQYVKSVQSQQ